MEKYLSLFDHATEGQHLLEVIDLLLNCAHRYQHSIIMNIIIIILSHHQEFNQNEALYALKQKNGIDIKRPATFTIALQKISCHFEQVGVPNKSYTLSLELVHWTVILVLLHLVILLIPIR
jgi:hypothetical protein